MSVKTNVSKQEESNRLFDEITNDEVDERCVESDRTFDEITNDAIDTSSLRWEDR